MVCRDEVVDCFHRELIYRLIVFDLESEVGDSIYSLMYIGLSGSMISPS